MARIAGVNLPKDKRIEAGLTAIFGIGRQLAKKIVEESKINPDTKIQDLTEEEEVLLRSLIEKYSTEGDLKRKVAMDVKRLQEIGSYRGFRHKKGMPVRGQRTRYNARTRKGKKRTVANKKIATK
ncbi:30S ribosomal protein S13 [Candidatus Peregrinibacteria bacterium]|jgi:small subunit ribosomal protein S13|nr:30S ribosomal protein S13 [Candidatus Peregrinibacteria bacterium]MBT7736418.1 30S ribosomal protein S13 [Candidatus Peregrinibacteria bacterium]